MDGAGTRSSGVGNGVQRSCFQEEDLPVVYLSHSIIWQLAIARRPLEP